MWRLLTLVLFVLLGCDQRQVTPSAAPITSRSELPLAQANLERVKRFEHIIYRHAETEERPVALRLDFYAPNAACETARPTVVIIHGGSFRGGSRRAPSLISYASTFARHGYNAVSIDYRLMGQDPLPSQPYREMAKRYSGYASTRVITTAAAAIEDTVAALDWLGDNASRYCVDPERFALFGFSAGAVIALQTTYSLNENGIEAPNISAVASYSGRLIPPNAIDVGDTPLFIIHGMDDLLVNYRHAEAMWARARAVATPVQLHAFMDAGHGVVRLYGDQIDGVPVMKRLITFFDQSFAGQLMPSQMTRNPLSQ